MGDDPGAFQRIWAPQCVCVLPRCTQGFTAISEGCRRKVMLEGDHVVANQEDHGNTMGRPAWVGPEQMCVSSVTSFGL